MATVKELKKYLSDLDENINLYIKETDDECEVELYTEDDIIEEANNHAGIDDFENDEVVEKFGDVDSAIQYMLEMYNDVHYYELSL